MRRGGGSGITVIFHLKDEKGRMVNPSLAPLDLGTDIVYADRYATHFMPLSPLKEKKYSQAIKNTLYHLVENYCIISLCFYFIMNGIVFVFICFLGAILCSDLQLSRLKTLFCIFLCYFYFLLCSF